MAHLLNYYQRDVKGFLNISPALICVLFLFRGCNLFLLQIIIEGFYTRINRVVVYHQRNGRIHYLWDLSILPFHWGEHQCLHMAIVCHCSIFKKHPAAMKLKDSSEDFLLFKPKYQDIATHLKEIQYNCHEKLQTVQNSSFQILNQAFVTESVRYLRKAIGFHSQTISHSLLMELARQNERAIPTN